MSNKKKVKTVSGREARDAAKDVVKAAIAEEARKKDRAVTPSPWTVWADCDGSLYVTNYSAGGNLATSADIQLMEAAPELLEAHKDLLHWYESLAEPGLIPNSLHSLIRDIKRLVAKAEGK